jgi:hypothetical protein
MSGLSIRNAIGPTLFLVGIAFLVARFFLGCTPAEGNAMAMGVEQAAAVAQYDRALVECQQAARQKPKDQRFEAYADCEQAVSKHFCSESKELRAEWARCTELGFPKE